jgi:hypothetical protein
MSEPTLFQADGDHYVPTEHSRGPWSPDLLHGGPVAALLAHELDDGSADWFPARFTADFMRPLAIAPMRITTDVVREGRRARLVDAELRSGDKLVARATLQQVRVAEVPVDADGPAKTWTATRPDPPEARPRSQMTLTEGGVAFHATSVEHRTYDGLLTAVGPANDWIRVDLPLLPGVELGRLGRVVAAADFGNGVSSSVPFDRYTFVNADLTVHLFRLPVDEWVLLEAVTSAADDGVGLAESALSDRLGRIGRSCQSLAIDLR